MKHSRLALAVAACCAATLCVAGPFDAIKGKMKPGMYEYKMDMDMGQMPGMPPGMGKQSHTSQHCVTPEQIEKGEMNKGAQNNPREHDCKIKNMNVSGNTATYTMECTNMKGEAKMVFTSDGYKMDSTMAMNQSGQVMNMKQHMEAKYLGPCK